MMIKQISVLWHTDQLVKRGQKDFLDLVSRSFLLGIDVKILGGAHTF